MMVEYRERVRSSGGLTIGPMGHVSGPSGRGAPGQNVFFLGQRELMMLPYVSRCVGLRDKGSIPWCMVYADDIVWYQKRGG